MIWQVLFFMQKLQNTGYLYFTLHHKHQVKKYAAFGVSALVF
jgi:hypothetical protein